MENIFENHKGSKYWEKKEDKYESYGIWKLVKETAFNDYRACSDARKAWLYEQEENLKKKDLEKQFKILVWSSIKDFYSKVLKLSAQQSYNGEYDKMTELVKLKVHKEDIDVDLCLDALDQFNLCLENVGITNINYGSTKINVEDY